LTWETHPLHVLARLVGGRTPSLDVPEYWGGPIPFVSPRDMASPEITTSQRTITERAVADTGMDVIPPGSVLVVIRSGVLSQTLPLAVAKVPLAISQDLIAIMPQHNRLDPHFLSFYLQRMTRRILSVYAKGTTVLSLDVTGLRQLPIPTPPINDQLEFVRLLKDMLATKAARYQADHATKAVLPTIGRKLFGQPSQQWPKVRLGEYAEIRRGVSPDPNITQHSLRRPCLRPADIRSGSLDLMNTPEVGVSEREYSLTALRRGDILLPLIVRPDKLRDEVLIWREHLPDCVYSDRLVRIRCIPPLLPSYMHFVISGYGKHLRQTASSIGEHSKIDAAVLSEVEVRVPPMELQHQFDDLFFQLVSLLERQEECRTALTSLSRTILRRVFAGHTTVM
jgi:type I restriction enzyme S subunit